MTLVVVHLIGGTVGRRGIASILYLVAAVLLQLLNTAGGRVLAGDLSTRLVADGGELHGATSRLVASRSGVGAVVRRSDSSPGTVIFLLALGLLFLLAGLPLLADFLEFCKAGCVSVCYTNASRSFGRPMLASG